MTCAEFDGLLEESGERCQICGRLSRYSPGGLLIDHDHALGWSAVRGLLCGSCNTSLAYGSIAGPEVDLYLARPWHARANRPAETSLESLLDMLGKALAVARDSKRRQLKYWRRDQQSVVEIETAAALAGATTEQLKAVRVAVLGY